MFLLGLCRMLYFIYSLWCMPFLIAVVSAPFLFLYKDPTLQTIKEFATLLALLSAMALLMLAVALIFLVYARKKNSDSNPWFGALMSWFGTLRLHYNFAPGPMVRVGLPSFYLEENPAAYKLKAEEMREILQKLQPGDILLRAYDGYLDGMAIKKSSKCAPNRYQPGWFSHVALYVGSLGASDRANVPFDFREKDGYFAEGPEMVIHSMAKGVHAEDILTWFRCDYLAVLRLNDEVLSGKKVEMPAPTVEEGRRSRWRKGESEMEAFPSEYLASRLRHRIRAKKSIDRRDAIKAALLSALEKIGEPYDFECVVVPDGRFHAFSCAELVYYCFRAVHDSLGLKATKHGFFPFGGLGIQWSWFERPTVTPDDFFDLRKTGAMKVVWIDPRSSSKLGVRADS